MQFIIKLFLFNFIICCASPLQAKAPISRRAAAQLQRYNTNRYKMSIPTKAQFAQISKKTAAADLPLSQRYSANWSLPRLQLPISKYIDLTKKPLNESQGQTALHKAAINNDKHMIILLLNADFNPNQEDYSGKTFYTLVGQDLLKDAAIQKAINRYNERTRISYKKLLLGLGIILGVAYGLEQLIEYIDELSIEGKYPHRTERRRHLLKTAKIIYCVSERKFTAGAYYDEANLIITAYDKNNNNEIVGNIEFSQSKGKIFELYVKPSYRNMGLGTALLRRALTELEKNSDLTKVSFVASAIMSGRLGKEEEPITNYERKKFYEKRGAKSISTHNRDCCEMEIQLNKKSSSDFATHMEYAF